MKNFIRTVTFARHGQSEQNVIKPEKVPVTRDQLALFRERDTGDHRLTDRGVADGRHLGDLVRHHELGPFSLLVTSSFVRAIETLLETGLEGPVEISPLLDERFSGYHEDLLKSELAKLYPNAGRDRRRKETRWRPDNGESMRDVLTRVLLFMEHLTRLPGGNENVFIMAHSRVMAAYQWWAEQLEDREVARAADAGTEGAAIVNGQVIQYAWDRVALRPTHKRILVPGQEIGVEWQELPQGTRYTTADLRTMVEHYPRILS